ncbi:hypothetical protein [Sulfitobacter sp.]|uniref:hypothetical protein n=1 Tax=Sulfitobacter sp. TaxID=1903071 RepID=UPI003001B434|tara:strand:+ start:7654 stop:8292 length:639 start_codon:yes stop_codon:yes gene_type:complete
MRPELEKILKEIGYTEALAYDRSLAFQFWEPNERGNRHFKDKKEAEEGTKHLRKITDLIQSTPPYLLALINDHARRAEDWETSRDPLFDVAFAVIELTALAQTEKDLIWSGPGASRRIAGLDIAKHLARIFVLGRGQMPGSGAKVDGEPSGDFAIAVAEVFNFLNFPDNFRRPCREAVAWLKADDYREFNQMMQMRATNGKGISLITGTVKN